MPRFEIDSITLRIPSDCLSDPLEQALLSGQYERPESDALRHHAGPGDRVLDLGAGAGFLCALAARTVGAENVLGVEANPRMVKVARANLERNGAGAAQILSGAVVPDDHAADTVRFLQRKPFWAGGIDPDGPDRPRHVAVPVVRLGTVLHQHRPSVVVMDIEGGEQALTAQVWPDCVRVVILEIHTHLYGAAGVRALFQGFFASGFAYYPWGSRGEAVVFARDAAFSA